VSVDLPHTFRIRQRLHASELADLPGSVLERIRALDLSGRIAPGASVAVGCSSRGIHRYDEIVRATVDGLRAHGLVPFLFPAMGSHGAATAAGQLRVLADAGISEATMGVPVRSSLEVIEIGRTPDDLPVLVDRMAWSADHLVLVNRIRAHTEFEHEFESGLQKMLAIGIGKEAGATLYHQAFMVDGYPAVIRAVADVVLGTGRFLFGVGVVEDAHGRTATVDALIPQRLLAGERELLIQAKRMTPALPFDDVDVLVVDEMGKEFSGTGIDTKVIGRILMPLVSPEPQRPRVKRIVVLGLTARTRGNADGVGLADFVTRRLVDAIDRDALYANAMAGAEPEHAKIPMAMDTDRDAVEAAVASVGRIPTHQLRLMWVKNTARLEELEVSEAYRGSLADRDDLEVLRHEALALPFDAAGRLVPRGMADAR
jgi:hypothetical protein